VDAGAVEEPGVELAEEAGDVSDAVRGETAAVERRGVVRRVAVA